MKGSQNPGSEFLRGTTVISYTALDKAGNAATCNFSVSIVEGEKDCLYCRPTLLKFCVMFSKFKLLV